MDNELREVGRYHLGERDNTVGLEIVSVSQTPIVLVASPHEVFCLKVTKSGELERTNFRVDIS